MASASSPSPFTDLHPLIIQTQILPRLDGQSLSSAATASSYIRALCADDMLWADICKSTWPSITHPRIHNLISTFPAGHRSFFQDSFQPPITVVKHRNHHRSRSISHPDCSLTHQPFPSELISAVDIRYHDDIIYSRAEFTDTTTEFLSSAFKIVLKDDPEVTGMPRSIDFNVEDVVDSDDATISHLQESITLNWILIDPTLKRAVNLSSIKPVLAWITDSIYLRYVVVLPGCGSNETVECRIEVKLGAGKGGVALYVREVILNVLNVACNHLSGKDFLVITNKAFLERYNIRRDVVECDVGRNQTKCVKGDETISGFLGQSYIIPRLSFLLCFCFLHILYCNII
ncbi:unnamed protein product [Lactuca virosa]|uniref:F-box domain-containing protein n=1 Tax=Lactuca virosa TaxID=75947 RepID=A0AAU9NND3_9ASTR|nr:unnamed protein product [Lactuca virosa]